MSSSNKSPRRRKNLAIILLSIMVSPLWPAQSTRILAQAGTGTALGSDAVITFASASAKSHGVLIEWRSNADPNNLGFNIYRLEAGRRTRVNAEIIPGVVFAGVRHVAPPGGYSYSRFDSAGTAESTYYIESVSVDGQVRTRDAISPSPQGPSAPSQLGDTSELATEPNPGSQKAFPAGSNQLTTPNGPIEDQWNVAAQTALKISIKVDGWYRVTQQQMSSAGFNPTVDIRNLSLFSDAREVAIGTSKDVGQLTGGDYIEFYGRGLDISTTDTRVYYLIAGTAPGKRIVGDVRTNSEPGPPAPVGPFDPTQPVQPSPQRWFGWLEQFLTGSDPVFTTGPAKAAPAESKTTPNVENAPAVALQASPTISVPDAARTESDAETPSLEAPTKTELPRPIEAAVPENGKRAPAVTGKSGRVSRKGHLKKASKRKSHRTRSAPGHAHATAASTAVSFNSTVEFKQRIIYFVSLLNGDTENYFGTVVASSPVTQTLNVLNPEMAADGPAKLEVALQGIAGQFFFNHSITVSFNGTQVATLNFGPLDRVAPSISIPVSQLLSGANTVTFTRTSTNDVSLIDYVRLTYPHALKADNNALRFSLRSTQAAKIDGFTGQDIKLIDYTDPFAVRVVRPLMEPTTAGYNIAVTPGAPSKFGRLLYAISDTQFATPAALSLNQPSTLNATNNGADLLIIAHKTLIPSAAPLVSLRQSQGMTVSVVDIEDVYDEFSYGTHGPQAIKDFLFRAKSSWATKPKYVIFLGDADLDPRNYEGVGNFDLVPTKLIDATYNETASDDWLTDFDNDGIGDIPSGRLPVRTPAEANLSISKIVNFTPSNAPLSALLVADDPTNYYFNFETANDEVETQLHSLVPSMTVQRINKRTDPNAHNNIINKAFGSASVPLPPGQGQSLVNYSGHGNVNTWTGANIFTSDDASVANNDTRLPLVLVMNCLNGYFQDPRLQGIAEALLKAPNGGAVAVFASSGETIPDGQHDMNRRLYLLIYGSPTVPLGDAIKDAKTFTTDVDVRRTWILFGDPSMKIR